MWRCCAFLSTCLFLAGADSVREPAITFSTLLGVADCDGVAAWQHDVFLACHSPESRLPVQVHGAGPTSHVTSAYVLRLNVKSGKLLYATRIGGADFTGAFRIKVDLHGSAFVVGFTKAHDFPTTPDAVQRRFAGGDSDAFLVKLNPLGEIVYATLLGGSDADQGNGLELDERGGVLVGGTTWSNDFPGQRTPRSVGRGDAFISHLMPGEQSSLRTVMLGGTQEEKLTGLVADRRGGLFAVGYTKSRGFPVVAATQGHLRGASDLFLARLRIPILHSRFPRSWAVRGMTRGGESR
jgi:hypothetical protein